MDIEHATIEEIIDEIAKRGYHGVIAIDDMEHRGSSETRRGVCVLGHPTAAVGMADEALRRARADVDVLLNGGRK